MSSSGQLREPCGSLQYLQDVYQYEVTIKEANGCRMSFETQVRKFVLGNMQTIDYMFFVCVRLASVSVRCTHQMDKGNIR